MGSLVLCSVRAAGVMEPGDKPVRGPLRDERACPPLRPFPLRMKRTGEVKRGGKHSAHMHVLTQGDL